MNKMMIPIIITLEKALLVKKFMVKQMKNFEMKYKRILRELNQLCLFFKLLFPVFIF